MPLMIGHGGMRGGGGGGRYNRVSRYQMEEPTRKADMKTVRRVAAAFKPYRRQVAVVLLAIMVVGVLGIVNPLMLKYSIAIGFGQQRFDLLGHLRRRHDRDPHRHQLDRRRADLSQHQIGQSVMRDLRNQLYSHLQQMPLQVLHRHAHRRDSVAPLQRHRRRAIGRHRYRHLDRSPISPSCSRPSSACCSLDWRLTLLSLGLLPLFILLTISRRQRAARGQQGDAKVAGGAFGDGRGDALGQRRAAHQDLWPAAPGDRALRQRERAARAACRSRQQMVGRWFMMFISTFFSISPALVYLLYGYIAFGHGAHPSPARDRRGDRHAGRLHHAAEPALLPDRAVAQRAGRDAGRASRSSTASSSISTCRSRSTDKPGALGARRPPTVRGDVAFERRDFPLPQPTSSGPRWTTSRSRCSRGSSTALVGPSGAGKTTITYLVAAALRRGVRRGDDRRPRRARRDAGERWARSSAW